MQVEGRTVILAAGDFPRAGTLAERILLTAQRVICCDRAGDIYHEKTQRLPDLVVGDGDSLRGVFPAVELIAEQETNDLAKALRVCAREGWTPPVVLGATGGRDDHALGNLTRLMAEGVEIVTNSGVFQPCRDELRLERPLGSPLSIFATDPSTRAESEGLAWPLKGVRFSNLYCATLNRVIASPVIIRSTGLLSVYYPYEF